MDERARVGLGSWRLALGLILATAGLVRLYRFQGPLVDQMFPKQVYIANKARDRKSVV